MINRHQHQHFNFIHWGNYSNAVDKMTISDTNRDQRDSYAENLVIISRARFVGGGSFRTRNRSQLAPEETRRATLLVSASSLCRTMPPVTRSTVASSEAGLHLDQRSMPPIAKKRRAGRGTVPASTPRTQSPDVRGRMGSDETHRAYMMEMVVVQLSGMDACALSAVQQYCTLVNRATKSS